MEVVNVRPIPTKGGSIEVTVQHAGGPREVTPRVQELIACEERDGIFGMDIHRGFAASVQSLRDEIQRLVARTRTAGGKICGYGASVGTVTLIAQFDLGDQLTAVFDDNADKHRLLRGPRYSLPILPPQAVNELDPDLIIVFAWRYADVILAKHTAWFDRRGVAIVPLPQLKIVRGDGASGK
jgi:hypothetical protein